MNFKLLTLKQYIYVFFILFSLSYFFLSTNYAYSKNISIENIEISKSFGDKFSRGEAIDQDSRKLLKN